MAKRRTSRAARPHPSRARKSKRAEKAVPAIRFGTDGWRGVLARDFTLENATLVARAVTRYLVEFEDLRRPVIIAYDTRFAAGRFARHIAEVLTSVGLRVQLADAPAPTPALSYAVRSTGAAAGIMLTASHNPPEWLGVKLKAGFGGSASPRVAAQIERYLLEGARLPLVAPDPRKISLVDLKAPYLKRLAELVDLDRIATTRLRGRPLRLAIDPMHGAGAGYLCELLKAHDIACIEVRGNHDPLFGGGQPEPLAQHLHPLRNAILEQNCNAGFATDGDADRIGAMDSGGRFVDPHKIFALIFRHLVESRGLTGAVARSFSVSRMIDRMAAHYRLPLHEVPIGFKHIAEQMIEHDLLIGGEESGGIGIRLHLPERDGLLNSLLLAEVIATEGKPLTTCVTGLQEQFGPLHYNRTDLRLTPHQKQRALKYFTETTPEKLGPWTVTGREDLDGSLFHLQDTGWVLVRASGTEPLVRIYAEADSSELADKIAATVGEIVQTV